MAVDFCLRLALGMMACLLLLSPAASARPAPSQRPLAPPSFFRTHFLVVLALASPKDSDATENWMASGVAVLLIAALSPLVIFQAVRIGHTAAGQVARGWDGRRTAGALETVRPASREYRGDSAAWHRGVPDRHHGRMRRRGDSLASPDRIDPHRP